MNIRDNPILGLSTNLRKETLFSLLFYNTQPHQCLQQRAQLAHKNEFISIFRNLFIYAAPVMKHIDIWIVQVLISVFCYSGINCAPGGTHIVILVVHHLISVSCNLYIILPLSPIHPVDMRKNIYDNYSGY